MSMPPVVVGLGEVLWDVFPDAAHFGGAPANFACHAACLGAEAWLVSAVGSDRAGDEASAELRRHSVCTDAVQRHPTRPTGVVRVTLDSHGQPRYEIQTGSAWDDLHWDEALVGLAKRCDAACFGSLAQRSLASREVIRRFLHGTRPDALRVFDVNLRQHYHNAALIRESLALANALKLNDAELPVVADYCGCAATDRDALRELIERFQLRLIALTRGPLGAILYASSDEHDCVAPDSTVVDTVGAGDSFTAALVTDFLAGLPLDVINRHANAVAAYVCSQKGATPILPEPLRPRAQTSA
jgi:fructokinase